MQTEWDKNGGKKERQKTEGGERQKRRGSRKRDEESGMRDKDKRKRNELDEVER